MAKKLSVLKPRRLRNLYWFSFVFSSHCNFEEIVTDLERQVQKRTFDLTNKIFNVQFLVIFHLGAKSVV